MPQEGNELLPLDVNDPAFRQFISPPPAAAANPLTGESRVPTPEERAKIDAMVTPEARRLAGGLPVQPQVSAATIAGKPVQLSEASIRKFVLDKIAAGESGGRYDVSYTPPGQKLITFSDYSKHPQIRQAIPGTDKSADAAGRYGFLSSTWRGQAEKLGLSDFSPESQDKAAWDLAQNEYKRVTGRNIIDDAQAGRVQWQALGGQWESLKGGGKPIGPGVLASARASAGPSISGSPSAGGGASPSAGVSVSPPLPSAEQTPLAATLSRLQLLQGLFPQHKFTPVSYDPYAVMPKLTG